MKSEGQFTEHIIVRVPKAMKRAFEKLCFKKTKKEAEVAREAFTKYFEGLGISLDQEIPGFQETGQPTKENQSIKNYRERMANASEQESVNSLPQKTSYKRAGKRRTSSTDRAAANDVRRGVRKGS